MKTGMAMHTYQTGTQTPHPLCRIVSPGLHQNKRDCFEAGNFLPPFLHCLLINVVDAITLSYLNPWLWYYWLSDVDIDQPGSSFSSVSGLLTYIPLLRLSIPIKFALSKWSNTVSRASCKLQVKS